MTNDEINALIELAAIRAAKQAISEARIEWTKDIVLHSSTCAIGKYRAIAHFISAAIGGLLVVVANWLIKRL